MTPQSVVLLARYNRWMNERLFGAAARLGHGELVADKGAFFGSILATLNHIAVADTVWLRRFARHEAGFPRLAPVEALPHPASLTHPLADDLAGLADYRRTLDALIEHWADGLGPRHLEGELTYRNLAGVASRKPFAGLVQHFFNHQTHHRGQVTTLLHQSGVDVGVTDLFALL